MGEATLVQIEYISLWELYDSTNVEQWISASAVNRLAFVPDANPCVWKIGLEFSARYTTQVPLLVYIMSSNFN